MKLSSASSNPQAVNPITYDNQIKSLQKQIQVLQEMIVKESQSDHDYKVKQVVIESYRVQIQTLEARMRKLQADKIKEKMGLKPLEEADLVKLLKRQMDILI